MTECKYDRQKTEVLIVDDNRINRDILSRFLASEGFLTHQAESGQEALAILSESPSIRLILLDIMMPGMSGLECLTLIREQRSRTEFPVIMVSAKSHSDDILEALDLGCNDFITKPVDFDITLARIDLCMEWINAQEDAKKSRNEAILAAKAKANFLSNMSHELRTPLNTIIGLSDILMNEEGLLPSHKTYVQDINISSESLVALINDILDFSKLTENAVSLESIEFSIEKLLKDCASIVSHSAHKKNIDITFSNFDYFKSNAYGDPNRIQQVLINLISNAIKFTQEGEVSVTVETLDDAPEQIKFTVKDTGIGISDSDIKHIFSSFSQADDSTTRKYGGTGLGLSISQKMVELMGGEISVKSEIGVGSEFTFSIPHHRKTDLEKIPEESHFGVFQFGRTEVPDAVKRGFEIARINLEVISSIDELVKFQSYLILPMSIDEMKTIKDRDDMTRATVLLSQPLRKHEIELRKMGFSDFLFLPLLSSKIRNKMLGEAENFPTEAVAKKSSKVKGLSILVVDDSEDNRNLLSVYLGKTNRLTFATNGQEAVDMYKTLNFDLVLMDMQMPVKSGYEASKEIRSLESKANKSPCKIIALTANTGSALVEKSIEAGCDKHLSKPIKKKLLVQTIEELRNVS